MLLKKLGEARDRGHTKLDKLVRRSLLRNIRKVVHYRMFEHFQIMSLRIANLNDKYRILVKDEENIEDKEWEHANRISLIQFCLSTPLKSPKCCRIFTCYFKKLA